MAAEKKPISPTTPEKSETAQREEGVLAVWRERDIFQKSLKQDAPKGEFVFYDGPPFATGLPHTGSLLASVIKDVVPRYKTMRGYHVRRRWGWDCHGLPIESLVEKKLGLKTKKDIENVGVAAFNEVARASVFGFEKEWEKYVERIGRWVDFKNSYKTMDNSYIESVWWALKRLHEKGLLYEGFKVLMYCPHCETPLAKAEIAMDNTYKDVTEEAVTVKFHLKPDQEFGAGKYKTKTTAYILAWTTTPWTLPGNVALVVGKDVRYTSLRVQGVPELLIVAHDLVEKVFGNTQIEIVHDDMTGADLVGLEYEPLFDVPSLQSEMSYRVYAADFVTTTDGTGIVHTAVMYGEDDFAVGQREGLPMVQLLDAGAHYNQLAPELVRGKYIKQGGKEIVADLERRGLMFAHAPHTHSYPHCYRCGTPLIYNAVASWFINIQKIKARMLQENEHITWVPEHLKHGRFKHIVDSAPDWTISRNRFWASPLPIWKERGGSRVMIIGSLSELKERAKKSGNRYLLMRHGEAEHMIKGVYSSDAAGLYGLTEDGRREDAETARTIPTDKPIVIVASPVRRTRETAEVVADTLGVPKENVVLDERLREIGFGEFEEKSKWDWINFMAQPEWFTAKPEGGENYAEIKKRFGEAIYDLERHFKNSTVVIVSHGVAFPSLKAVCDASRGENLFRLAVDIAIPAAAMEELPFVPLPVNVQFELDLHRPYTDAIVLLDDEGREYDRIPEVIDCWAESGVMPFAEYHYPFEGVAEFEKRAPGDFVAEYVGQTRAWFYYMHAMAVALFDRLSFRSAVVTGNVLATDGSKMSKSKNNFTDPMLLMGRFGADALRFCLMNSVVMQSEDIAFRDEDVREVHNRVIGMLWNTAKFFELYKSALDPKVEAKDSTHPLDRWVLSMLGTLVRGMTDAMERYDTPQACRALRAFVDDYSTWYVRRSRERVKGVGSSDANTAEDGQFALATQKEVLLTFARLAAPIIPFISESVYQLAGGERESVHLETWPEDIAVDEKLMADMALIRAAASRGLELRDRAGIKVRQPLALLRARELPEDEMLRSILADEVNVKHVEQGGALPEGEDAWLDTQITDELREEGVLRDVLRAIQDLRKKEGLSVGDRPALRVHTDATGAAFFENHRAALMAQTGLSRLDIKEDAELEPSATAPFPTQFFVEK